MENSTENLGFTTYPPAYLSLKSKGTNLLNGVNFASASSGYYSATAKLYHAIPLNDQLEHFKDCLNILVGVAGKSNASSIISGAIYVISAGNSDFIQNYYLNPLLYKNLYALGARRIGVTTLPPMGCLPAAITLYGSDSNECVERLNHDAVNFNKKLNTTSQSLQKQLPDLKLVAFDIYQPLYDLVTKPTENGFFESRKACCGTGLLETSVLCNNKSIGTCANASEYVFWDAFHPTDAANKILAEDLLIAGISLIS
ncbi:hypothetical protein TanjilG_30177 [Lupinus angustifolius]|uniref:GDSL esterase/lipase n=1 Tax=Lupinus angustifolius TaxID=3871 RepID=A0A4P1R6T6_LUPAN|nr:hypothetical protein TanjilG_30177 [Lupinus angustifolius]